MTDGNSELKWPKILLLTKSYKLNSRGQFYLSVTYHVCPYGMLGLCALCCPTDFLVSSFGVLPTEVYDLQLDTAPTA